MNGISKLLALLFNLETNAGQLNLSPLKKR
jgi:hypothetical protein